MTPIVAPLMPGYLGFRSRGLIAILPIALLMGIAFPIGLHLWAAGTRVRQREGARLGRFYSLNVAGAIAGSLVGRLYDAAGLGSRTSLTCWRRRLRFRSRAARRLRSVAPVAHTVRRCCADRLCRRGAGGARSVRRLCRPATPAGIVWKDESVEATAVVHGAAARTTLTVNGNHRGEHGRCDELRAHRIGHLAVAFIRGAYRAGHRPGRRRDGRRGQRPRRRRCGRRRAGRLRRSAAPAFSNRSTTASCRGRTSISAWTMGGTS